MNRRLPLSGLGLVCLVTLACASAGSAEPPCDPALRPVQGEAGYTPRRNRCEGLYVSPISAPGLELVSLLRGKIRYDLHPQARDRKSTRLNSSHDQISYAVFCLKKKKK